MAVPSPSGTAISSAMKALTKVPKMNVNAPKSPLTGSQLEWTKKPQPNLLRERDEPLHRVHPTRASSTSTIIAISQVTSRKILSPALPGGARAILSCAPVLPETAAEFIRLISAWASGSSHVSDQRRRRIGHA